LTEAEFKESDTN